LIKVLLKTNGVESLADHLLTPPREHWMYRCDDLTVFIPTRNSGKWIGIFLDEYRKFNIEPLYILDARSDDDTCAILENRNAHVITCSPVADYAEAGMIECAFRHINTSWALRFDDDEFPSQSLMSSLEAKCSSDFDAWYFPRREVSFRNGKYLYFNSPLRYHFYQAEGQDYKTLCPQLRLLRKNKIRFNDKVHTPGVVIPEKTGYADHDIFFVHCKNFLLSAEERLNKVRKYAHHDRERAWSVLDEYIPEIFDPDFSHFCHEDLLNFFSFFDRLPKAEESKAILANDEVALAYESISKRLADPLGFWGDDRTTIDGTNLDFKLFCNLFSNNRLQQKAIICKSAPVKITVSQLMSIINRVGELN
jgi:hypothetical protein